MEVYAGTSISCHTLVDAHFLSGGVGLENLIPSIFIPRSSANAFAFVRLAAAAGCPGLGPRARLWVQDACQRNHELELQISAVISTC